MAVRLVDLRKRIPHRLMRKFKPHKTMREQIMEKRKQLEQPEEPQGFGGSRTRR